MNLTETIREYVRMHYLEPARASGKASVKVSASEIAHEIGLRDRFPAICNAMDAETWRLQHRLQLLDRRGPPQSSKVVWVFGLPSLRIVADIASVEPNPSDSPKAGAPDPRALRGRLVRRA